ncbi:MAG: anaerobic ribonucleoside-triphosphate reductase activating protein [Christensenellales bacterium]|nr:anaerobic ribonucleoside-triphosphate reductase activating protein [Christensenellales bacterium]
MKIRLAGLTNDSIVDGTGLRLTVFVQGCPHRCPGCHNPQTHDFHGGYDGDTDQIMKMVEENILLDGVTLSGGEPFAQPEPCTDIAQKVHAAGLNVWCYTGYLFEELMASDHRKRALLEHIDVLVDGPFQLEKRTLEARFRGSSNQRILDVPQSIKMGKAVLMTFDPA